MGKIKKTIAFLIALLPLFSLTTIPVFASATYSYDANGNLTSDGVNCYTYNDANQVSQVKNCVNNQTVAQYVYDYQGNRLVKKNYVSGTLNNTVYSPDDGYETKKLSNGSTQNTTYYYVNDDLVAKKNPDGTKNYYLKDNLGSASILASQSGSVIESTTYYPFGAIRTGGTKSKYLYTGQENDPESGLDYYNARYYSPQIRHFTQPDTVIADPYNPQDLNRYSYVNNNPLTYTDPSGHQYAESAPMVLGAGLFVGGIEYLTNPSFRKSANALAPVAKQGAMNNWQNFWGQVNNFFGWNNEDPKALRGAQNPYVKATAAYGRDMHASAQYGAGYQKELTIGSIRLDAGNEDMRHFIELKPNTPSGIKQGYSQINYYIKYLQDTYGQKWTGELRTYEPPTTAQLKKYMK